MRVLLMLWLTFHIIQNFEQGMEFQGQDPLELARGHILQRGRQDLADAGSDLTRGQRVKARMSRPTCQCQNDKSRRSMTERQGRYVKA